MRQRLGIKKNFFLLHDVYHDYYKINDNSISVNPKSVFCGGHNGRDWNFIIQLAHNMPDITFNLVMPIDVYNKYKATLPDNVNAKYNIPLNEFMEEMCKSAVVALPLDTEAPAGLIVMFQAVANMKYIITTDTMTTREYLAEGKGCLLPNNVTIWTKTIKERVERKEDNEIAATKLLHFLQTDCNEKMFIAGVKCMIKTFDK